MPLKGAIVFNDIFIVLYKLASDDIHTGWVNHVYIWPGFAYINKIIWHICGSFQGCQVEFKEKLKSRVSRYMADATFRMPGELSLRRLTQANLSDRTLVSKSIRFRPSASVGCVNVSHDIFAGFPSHRNVELKNFASLLWDMNYACHIQ